jgi:magnesium-transporting ATPase (P-type)
LFLDPNDDGTQLYVGIVLVAVALLLGTLSYIYNSRLEYTLKKIQKISHQATVLINGKLKLVDITDLVVGDLVFVSAVCVRHNQNEDSPLQTANFRISMFNVLFVFHFQG